MNDSMQYAIRSRNTIMTLAALRQLRGLSFSISNVTDIRRYQPITAVWQQIELIADRDNC